MTTLRRGAICQRDFALVAIGQIISILGNQVLRYALPLYLLGRTGSSALFGTILAVSYLPMLVLYPIGGILADCVNKRNIMVALDFATALLIAVFCVLQSHVDIVPLMAATMIILYGIQGAYQPAVKASVPALVDAAHMMQANAVVDVINSTASMAGPVIGGILFSALGLSPVLWKISLLFAASNLLLTSLVLIGLPVIITQRLGFAPDTANRFYGYAQGVVAAGAVLGGLVAGALSGKIKARAAPALLVGCSLSVIIGGMALHLLLTLHTVFQIQMMTLLQRLTPHALIGKVVACFMCVVMCTSPLGQLLYGFVLENIGEAVYIPFYAAGLAMIGITAAPCRVFAGIDGLAKAA